ncbi:uncharacterized protein LOC143430303 [Xylocopa sonorina]|uniref:uncharacterized protein LOC143430303 n=1 Tax=Xylocopa sonorina TaxID=1818115 RepID=UPI00403A85A1
MKEVDILRNYTLSQSTIEKLKTIKKKLNQDIVQADPLWQIVTKKNEEKTHVHVEKVLNETNKDCNNILLEAPDQFHSTQFYFTQFDNRLDENVEQEHLLSKWDIAECIFEGLECSNGKLSVNHLENLTDIELFEVACNLEKRLSTIGTYNLCCSMNNMTLDQQIKYAPIFYSHIILPKIISLEKPSRLLLSALTESTQKFPDDIQKLIFIPLLNVDLKDTTLVDAIVNTLEPQRHSVLITEYLSNVVELKSWHLSFLNTLVATEADIIISDTLIRLLFEKAVDFAKDKNFGKLVLSFVKTNIKFSEEQKHLLWEIVNIHETLFKRPIEKILKAV